MPQDPEITTGCDWQRRSPSRFSDPGVRSKATAMHLIWVQKTGPRCKNRLDTHNRAVAVHASGENFAKKRQLNFPARNGKSQQSAFCISLHDRVLPRAEAKADGACADIGPSAAHSAAQSSSRPSRP